MLSKVRIVRNSCKKSAINPPVPKTRQTLLLGQVRHLIGRHARERKALSIIAVLKDDSQAIGGLHQDLDYCAQVNSKPGQALHKKELVLPVCRFENRLSTLVSPPMYK
jgi:hypothetical protein